MDYFRYFRSKAMVDPLRRFSFDSLIYWNGADGHSETTMKARDRLVLEWKDILDPFTGRDKFAPET